MPRKYVFDFFASLDNDLFSSEQVKLVKRFFQSPETMNNAKLKPEYFTRAGALTALEIFSFMLDTDRRTLKTRLIKFYQANDKGEAMSQQAFSELRVKFDESPFAKAIKLIVQNKYCGTHVNKTYKGYHIFGVDGTHLTLPKDPKLVTEFGYRGNIKCPTAGASVLFDVLQPYVLDAIITHSNMNERDEYEKHIDNFCSELPVRVKDSIFLSDRGYAALKLFTKHDQLGVKYVIRCSSKALAEINNAPVGSSIIELRNGITIRVIKFYNLDGKLIIFATNLFEFAEEDFPELYRLRWGIEIGFKEIKHQLCIEKFSGRTAISIRQDFYASLLLYNLIMDFEQDANAMLQKQQEGKDNKYVYRVRTGHVIEILRDEFIFTTLSSRPIFTAKQFQELLWKMTKLVSPIRPGRTHKRGNKKLEKYAYNNKNAL